MLRSTSLSDLEKDVDVKRHQQEILMQSSPLHRYHNWCKETLEQNPGESTRGVGRLEAAPGLYVTPMALRQAINDYMKIINEHSDYNEPIRASNLRDIMPKISVDYEVAWATEGGRSMRCCKFCYGRGRFEKVGHADCGSTIGGGEMEIPNGSILNFTLNVVA
jgi:hypothetical protein